MKILRKNSIAYALISFFVLGLFGQITVFAAATSPSLLSADSYSILSGTTVTNVGATTISGDVGISPAGGGGATGWGTVTLGGTLHDSDGTAATAQADKNTAYAALTAQGCNTTYVGVFKELAGVTLVPGVYCADSFHLTNGTLTLSGSSTDVWVFKSASDLIITGGASNVVFVGTGVACNVWWSVVSTATFDAGSEFVGNVLADTSITFAAGASLDGRALARTAEVTMDSTSITGPTCAVAQTGVSSQEGTINVVKLVINDNGGTKKISDFPLFVNDKSVSSGVTNSFFGDSTYTVHETADSKYTATFSGDCDSTGHISLSPGSSTVCVITNDDIGAPIVIPPVPPLISVVKVPSPLSLPNGAGTVKYTYTVKNIGTVPMTDVTLVGDTCSPIVINSGDLNSDKKLDLNETWIYTCSTKISETHTNTVVATGWANGLSATDIASATVVVGKIVPPLINVIKLPSPMALLAGGGMVNYINRVTNPGIVPLNNVKVVDDKCSPAKYVSGDSNEDLKLDMAETWVYTCQSNITKTTTNTVTATGEANGITVKDLAVATVVVASAVPGLPNTGFPIQENILLWAIIAALFAVVIAVSFYTLGKRNSKHRKA